MAKKSRVGEPELKKIGELQAAARVAQSAAAKARHTDIEATDAFERKLKSLQIKLATGSYSTGDHLLDINIVVNSSVEKDERYDAMVEFEKVLGPHGGELAAEAYNPAGIPQVRLMGLLPKPPKLQLRVGGAFGRGLVLGGDASVNIVTPVVEETGTVIELLPVWEGPRDKATWGSNIIFEDKLQWILENEPNMKLAVALWSNAYVLGRPLTPPDRVIREIMVRRESCAIGLQATVSSMRSALQALKEAQRNTQYWVPSQIEEDGPRRIVSFPTEMGNIKRQRKQLAEEIRVATRLGMNGNPASSSYMGASDLLRATAEWAD